jgi:hypothetical protein
MEKAKLPKEVGHIFSIVAKIKRKTETRLPRTADTEIKARLKLLRQGVIAD